MMTTGTSNKKRGNTSSIKAKRRFTLMFSTSFLVSLYIMVKASFITPTPWYIDAIFVVLVTVGFSVCSALLFAMKFKQLKQNKLSLFLIFSGIALSIALQLMYENFLYFHTLEVMTGAVFFAAILRNETFETH